jgi:hypothetical protein
MVRAALWLVVVAAISASAILSLSNLDDFARRARDPKLAIEVVATLLTGVAAVIAAFHLSLPDRSLVWAFVPIPPLIVWLASIGYSCYRHWIIYGSDGWALGQSADCFRLILGVGVPLGFSLVMPLRRAQSLTPIRVAAVGGLGVAGIAAFVLQFFHPFDVTFADLGAQVAAMGILIAAASVIEGSSHPRRDIK